MEEDGIRDGIPRRKGWNKDENEWGYLRKMYTYI